MDTEADYQRATEYVATGSYERASNVLKATYEKSLNYFGKVHEDVFKVQLLLAQIYEAQGKKDEAYNLLKELHKNQLNTFGPNREETLTTWNTMAAVLCELGRSDEALEIFQEIYAKRKPLIGEKHQDTLLTQNYMVTILAQKGQDVMPTLYEIYKTQKEMYPLDPSTFVTGWNISNELVKKGKQDEAMILLKEMFLTQRQNRRLHRGLLQTLSLMADIYSKQGKSRDALEVYRHLVKEYDKLFGENNPKSLNAESSIATLCIYNNNYKVGLKSLNIIYNKQKVLFGEESLETIVTLSRIAGTYSLMGEHNLALFFYRKVHDIEKRKHPTMADSMLTYQCIGSVLKNLGKFDEAVAIFREIYEALKTTLGSDHSRVLEIQSLIANSYFYKGDYDNALAVYSEVFDVQEQKHGDDHEETLATQSSIAGIHLKKGDYDKALEIYAVILEIQIACMGPDSKAALTTQTNIAMVYSRQKRYQEAKKQYEKIYKQMSKKHGSDHPSLLTIQSKIAYVLMDQRKYQAALNMFEELAPKMEDCFGKEHPDTKRVTHQIEVLQNLFVG
ncbi:hypothetical protein JTE90_021559 [Oedothorax gibbosus]|uniref:Kinesin light chain n=1 Tax=Oedothorax gibbosus TaxID=931172 RepID=A0AAV6VQ97_9ARAC|nr:hypothetical protein JTE90_021559 [Oedothorax gibbosus]